MTVSSSTTREFSVNKIVTMALRKAGQLNVEEEATEAALGAGRDLLETVLDHLQTQGLSARQAKFYELELTEGTHIYTMPESTMDVVGTAMFIDETNTSTTQTEGETHVQPIDRQRYQTLSSKGATGRPTLYYTHREATLVQVWLWPVPSEGGTIRFQTQRLLADVQQGQNTVDLERYWTRCLVQTLAAEIAEDAGLSVAKVASMEAKAARLLQACKSYSMQHVNTQVRFGHRTSWSNR